MNRFFTSYEEARCHAQSLANEQKRPIALKATNEYGKRGYVVRGFTQMDSDAVLAEIIVPIGSPPYKVPQW